MKSKLIILSLLLMANNYLYAQSTWKFDKSHSIIQFKVSHLMINEVSGSFKVFDGSVKSTVEDFDGSDIEFSAESNTLSTDNEKRDGHLKSEDFFNAGKYPELIFKGKLVRIGGKYHLKGELTIRDITKPIEFEVKYNGTVQDPWGNTVAGFKVSGSIDRFDYGLKWNSLMEAGGAVVGSEVEIICNIELHKQA